MNKMHIFIEPENRATAIRLAGGPLKVSRWLNQLLHDIEHGPEQNLEALKLENIRLKGEITGLRFALSLRPAGVTLHEGLTDGQCNSYETGHIGTGNSDPSGWVHER
jgi:hypothetical protein